MATLIKISGNNAIEFELPGSAKAGFEAFLQQKAIAKLLDQRIFYALRWGSESDVKLKAMLTNPPKTPSAIAQDMTALEAEYIAAS